MTHHQKFTGLIEKDDNQYVALCPELDIASQGKTVEEARLNLIEAIELFYEVADPSEIESRLQRETLITEILHQYINTHVFKGKGKI